jgi:Putative peptidoglycan binding domain
MKNGLFLLLFATQIGFAQKQFVLDTLVDAPENIMSCGRCFARCIWADTGKLGHFSMTLSPPKWDSSFVELYPEYTYYALRKNAIVAPSQKGETVRIEPPKYDVKREKKRLGTEECQFILVERANKPDCLATDPKMCLHLCAVEIPIEYRSYQIHTLIELAKIVRQRGKIQVIETIDSTSPLLMKVVVPSQNFMLKTHKKLEQHYRIEADFEVKLGEWRQVVCCMYKVQEPKIIAIQRALKERGYKVKIDGVFGLKTKAALVQFQQSKGLEIGTLNATTLKALGISDTDVY